MALPDLSEIKRIRKALKITQSELAEKSGVSQSLIARLESDSADPRYSKVANIFRALDKIKKEEITSEDIMKTEVVGVKLADSVERVVKIMNKYHVSQIPVFEKKRVVGSISERGILDEVKKCKDLREFSKSPISAIIEHPFPTVNKKTTLSTITKILEDESAAIVIEKGDVLGIITKSNLLKVVSK